MVSILFRKNIGPALKRALGDLEKPMARAATDTMRETANEAKLGGRASIASAGFSPRWQNALRGDSYPSSRAKPSIDAAAYIYHKIGYAHVFEFGETIKGRPFLWLPLPNVPKRVGRAKMSPRIFNSRIGKLVSIRRRSGPPLLGASIRLSKANEKRGVKKITLSALKRGDSGGKGKASIVPVFFGIPSVTIKARFGVLKACARAADNVPFRYAQNIAKEV